MISLLFFGLGGADTVATVGTVVPVVFFRFVFLAFCSLFRFLVIPTDFFDSGSAFEWSVATSEWFYYTSQDTLSTGGASMDITMPYFYYGVIYSWVS